MITSKKRVFSAEFKHEAAELVLSQNYSISEAAKAMGIGKSTLSKWLVQVKSERCGITPKASAITHEQRQNREVEHPKSLQKSGSSAEKFPHYNSFQVVSQSINLAINPDSSP